MNLQIIQKDIKHIYIRIKAPSQVIVSVPLRTTQKSIDRVLQERANWIEKKLRAIQHKHPIQINYIDNDKLWFLGESYTLQIIASHNNNVTIYDDTILLYTQHPHSKEYKAKIIQEWYYAQAKLYFEEAISKYHPLISRPIHAVRIKEMKTRWGSCNHTKGYINLNVELIKKPLKALEYVVFHELVHLLHPNHGKDFYGFIEKYMRDWKARVSLLKQI